MSRTWHHGDRAKERTFGLHRYNAPPRQKQPRSQYDWHPMHNTPSYWINAMMTRKQRAQTRAALGIVLRMTDQVDDPWRWGFIDPPIFPLAKKPHIYFW